jgi:hypothetical protein
VNSINPAAQKVSNITVAAQKVSNIIVVVQNMSSIPTASKKVNSISAAAQKVNSITTYSCCEVPRAWQLPPLYEVGALERRNRKLTTKLKNTVFLSIIHYVSYCHAYITVCAHI